MIDLNVVKAPHAEHSIVHRREDRFAAWPFNCGVWKFPGDEIVVGFVSRTCRYKERFEVFHGYSPNDGQLHFFLSRSKDGGCTWSERPLTEIKDLEWRLCHGSVENSLPVDFSIPDMLLHHMDDYVMLSSDRGVSFQAVSRLPHCGHARVMGRPDYVIRPDGACVLFSTVSTTTGVEGRPVVYISRNGGVSWEFMAYMTREPQNYMIIMPSGVWLPNGRMIAAVRCQMQKHGYSFWSEVYASDDGGRTWRFLSRVNDLGAPCHLLLLKDGRVLATYGYRSIPFGIRARISTDGGTAWGPEIILRDDGKSWDLGYPKTVQLDSGELMSFYYFNDRSDPVNVDGGVRYIGSTRWTAP